MSTTLIGVFDDATRAREAARRLEEAGIDRESINVRADAADIAVSDSEDRRGFFARLFGIFDDDESPEHYGEAVRRGHAVVSVTLDDDARTERATTILEDCGAADVDERVAQWRTEGYTPVSTAGGTMARDDAAQTLQSVEEELKVGKRTVERGRVRVHRTATERPVEQQVTLRDETVSIDRRRVDRPATEAEMQSAFKDEDIEIRETSEEPVVSKSARVVEEVTIGKTSSERTETVRDTVRSTQVDVDGISDDTTALMRRYTGPERRVSVATAYTGVERRVAHA
jgi:uncharacterized protein (TIGR02271 family)